MPDQSRPILYYGQPDPLPQPYSLYAGPLSLRFETKDESPNSFWQSKGREQTTVRKGVELSLLSYTTAFVDGDILCQN